MEEAYDSVRGTKSGYAKGLGYQPKPTSSASNSRTRLLEEALSQSQEALKETREALKKSEEQYSDLQARMALVEKFMRNQDNKSSFVCGDDLLSSSLFGAKIARMKEGNWRTRV